MPKQRATHALHEKPRQWRLELTAKTRRSETQAKAPAIVQARRRAVKKGELVIHGERSTSGRDPRPPPA